MLVITSAFDLCFIQYKLLFPKCSVIKTQIGKLVKIKLRWNVKDFLLFAVEFVLMMKSLFQFIFFYYSKGFLGGGGFFAVTFRSISVNLV